MRWRAADYFRGFTAGQPHPHMPATGTEGRCELCSGEREAVVHEQRTRSIPLESAEKPERRRKG